MAFVMARLQEFYKAACLMLGIASLVSLQLHEKHLERLTMQWPRCWGLIWQAEDKVRAEHLSKIRRRFLVDESKGLTMPDDWVAESPWTTCFKALVADAGYWNEQVRHPAASWLTARGRGNPFPPAEQIAVAHMPGGNELLESEDKIEGRRRQASRDKRHAKEAGSGGTR